ncbi:hypothetical protein GCM10022255_093440 [Dactylosporangium darangshiense]|uniref:Uncharacterized protein n=1 Tax=Dactylosporangium darangshiense TaxID=579108 RepID=A0ABP8DQB0_9ACTN
MFATGAQVTYLAYTQPGHAAVADAHAAAAAAQPMLTCTTTPACGTNRTSWLNASRELRKSAHASLFHAGLLWVGVQVPLRHEPHITKPVPTVEIAPLNYPPKTRRTDDNLRQGQSRRHERFGRSASSSDKQ